MRAQVLGHLRHAAAKWRPPHFEEDSFTKARWSMRFSSPEVEDAFNKDRLPSMLLNISRVFTLLFLTALRSLVVDLVMLSEGSHTFTPREWIDHACLLVCTVVSVMAAVLARVPWFQSRVGFRSCEAFIVATAIFLLAWSVGASKATWNEYGFDSHDLYDARRPASASCSCESQVLLSANQAFEKVSSVAEIRILALILDAFLTVLHLALPLRWYIFFWIDVSYIVAFTAQAYSVEPFAAVVFVGLVTGACAGTRSQELTARTLFATILDERTRRAQAEFRSSVTLGQGPGQRRSWDEATQSSDKPSRGTVETTDTAAMFSEAARQESLEDIFSLGLREQWLIKRDELEVSDQVLGSGGCGTVFAGKFCNSPVAVKQYTDRGQEGEGASAASQWDTSLLNELRIFRHVRHPNIVLFHGAFVDREDDGNLLLVLERVRGPTLSRFVARQQAEGYSPTHATVRVEVMLQVINTLIYLHSRRPAIIHADLKPGNVIIETREGSCFPKLLDFGLARTVTRGSKLEGGTPQYVAPEVVRLRSLYRPEPSCDVFSLGRVLFFVASGRSPLVAVPAPRLIAMMRRGEPPPSLAWAPKTMLLARQRGIIESCTAFDPQSRPSTREVFDAVASSAPRGPQEAGRPAAPMRMERVPEGPEPAAEAEAAEAEGPAPEDPEPVPDMSPKPRQMRRLCLEL